MADAPVAFATGGGLTLNLADDVRQLLTYHFMVNALVAGTAVAVMAAVVGWFMVLRRQAFAGHTLSLIAFPGAAGASLIGVPAAWGYFTACGLAGADAVTLDIEALRGLLVHPLTDRGVDRFLKDLSSRPKPRITSV